MNEEMQKQAMEHLTKIIDQNEMILKMNHDIAMMITRPRIEMDPNIVLKMTDMD